MAWQTRLVYGSTLRIGPANGFTTGGSAPHYAWSLRNLATTNYWQSALIDITGGTGKIPFAIEGMLVFTGNPSAAGNTFSVWAGRRAGGVLPGTLSGSDGSWTHQTSYLSQIGVPLAVMPLHNVTSTQYMPFWWEGPSEKFALLALNSSGANIGNTSDDGEEPGTAVGAYLTPIYLESVEL